MKALKTLPTKLIIAGLIVWSILMFMLGNFSGVKLGNNNEHVLIPPVHAASLPTNSKKIIRLDHTRLSGQNLGEYAPYEPESGNLVAHGYEYFYSKDGNFGLGVWESKPGKMTYQDLEYDELMFILDGSMVMTDAQGTVETFTQGEGLVLPKGWSGTLAVPDGGVRKIWVAYMGGKKGQ